MNPALLGWGFRAIQKTASTSVTPRKNTERTKIREILREGPATSIDVAMEMGISVRLASAHLSWMFHKNQEVTRSVFHREGLSRAYLYVMKEA
ncbi:MAG: hypothetical protein ACOH2T_19060 [Pseudomonas sp.]